MSSESGEPYTILARGPWEAPRVVSRRVERRVEPDAATRAAIEAHWRGAIERASARKQRLWNGPIYGLSAFRESSGKLELDFHATDFREFVGTNCAPAYLRRPREHAPRADALGLSVLVLTPRDDTIIFHRRGQGCFEWPLAIDTPGGHMEPGRHEEGGAPSPFAAALDELESELGLARAEVSELRALGLTRIADTEKPQLVLAARVALSPDEIRERVASARESFETDELVPIALGELARLDRELVTPAGRAGIRFAREMLARGGSC